MRWLIGFAAVTAAPGESVTATVPITVRCFADWVGGGTGWHYEPGEFTLHAGTSVTELPLTATVAVE